VGTLVVYLTVLSMIQTIQRRIIGLINDELARTGKEEAVTWMD
jgi:hypothetical protein